MGDQSRLRAVVAVAEEMAAAPGLPQLARAAAEGVRAALGGASAAVAARERGEGTAERLRELARAGEPPGAGGPPQLILPLAAGGRPWGELRVTRGPGAPAFGPDEADLGAALAAVIAAGLAQYERLAEASRLAFTDPLTGLANRRAVDVRLADAVRRHRATGEAVSLVVCDVNGLKRVNDTYGHAQGDRLLERFGALLAGCAEHLPGALAARLGGDEFCLVAVGSGAEAVERVAEAVCRRARELEPGEGVACGMASTGEAGGPPATARRLFRLADAAQYRAKATGAPGPVVAGRDAPDDPVLALADAPPPPGPTPGRPDRRRFRGARRPGGA
ncbi:GGDEF domain-containing protein [Streptomyces sp. DSM 44917]|uniref:GGDEF domain-containing protein n=1 Tax=Streptomyces boetiae TaxID=3075541 RepID=A0ABU2L9U8_9ACTN|nr:GGDEF domain-containing protein [Streptomyces sp. DSM 44917]MDT0308107.1 GGDEF domain-containing protein [Streptomyces sp. DSM 44917]